ncbi:hypothetical protein MUK42_24219 [Musa troglodytarum]|uniref:Uncharacterized protein n=1 Tax=Musa troglodytarum TaxID=320322 RepID=A0A9E7EZG4_9LILI|nr:hypothetical protein MUK42_24219 [Musa troglodytarum]
MKRSASHPLVHQSAVISIRLDVNQWCIEYPMLISDSRLVEVGVRLFDIMKLPLLQCSCQGIRHPRPPAAVLYIALADLILKIESQHDTDSNQETFLGCKFSLLKRSSLFCIAYGSLIFGFDVQRVAIACLNRNCSQHRSSLMNLLPPVPASLWQL